MMMMMRMMPMTIESLLLWLEELTLGFDFRVHNTVGRETCTIAFTLHIQVFVHFGEMILHLTMEFALVFAPAAVLIDALPLLSGDAVAQETRIAGAFDADACELVLVGWQVVVEVERVDMGCENKSSVKIKLSKITNNLSSLTFTMSPLLLSPLLTPRRLITLLLLIHIALIELVIVTRLILISVFMLLMRAKVVLTQFKFLHRRCGRCLVETFREIQFESIVAAVE